jgi:hypothetical protein
MTLGRLKKLDLRSHWPHEAHNFTKWLSLPENLDELSDEVGIGIELIQTEANVGCFHVDILGQEENTGKKVIIENQLEDTDHSHLGQIITYAAGIEAEYIIWIVRSAREEHTQAIDWLNNHTDEKLNFFLVCVELWQIEQSPPAPKFTVLCLPNEWTKSVRSDTASKEGLTETKTMQIEFWQQLRAYGTEKFPELKLRTPEPQHWYDIAIGRSDCRIALTTNTKENLLGAEIYINADKELPLVAHQGLRSWVSERVTAPCQTGLFLDPDGIHEETFWLVTDTKNDISWYMGTYGTFKETVEAL